MARIVVSENISIDGVMQDPTGEEGFARGGWFNRIGDADRRGWAELGLEEALAADALLLGRRSYEFLAARWPSRTGAWADRLNGLPKHVVSSTLADPAWNATVIRGDVVAAVTTLKRELDGEILVPGSRRLVRALLDHDLVDELRLVVFPVVLGAGDRLFGDTDACMPHRLLDSRRVGDSLALLTYQLVR